VELLAQKRRAAGDDGSVESEEKSAGRSGKRASTERRRKLTPRPDQTNFPFPPLCFPMKMWPE
jgi:hypothetical protein